MKTKAIRNLLKASKLALSLLDNIARDSLSLNNDEKEILDFLARSINEVEKE